MTNLFQTVSFESAEAARPTAADHLNQSSDVLAGLEQTSFQSELRDASTRRSRGERERNRTESSDENGLASRSKKTEHGEEGSSRSASLSPKNPDKVKDRSPKPPAKKDDGEGGDDLSSSRGEDPFLRTDKIQETPQADLASASHRAKEEENSGKTKLSDQIGLGALLSRLQPGKPDRALQMPGFGEGRTSIPEEISAKDSKLIVTHDSPSPGTQPGNHSSLGGDLEAGPGLFSQGPLLSQHGNAGKLELQEAVFKNLQGEVKVAEAAKGKAEDFRTEIFQRIAGSEKQSKGAEAVEKAEAPAAPARYSRLQPGSLEDHVLRQIRVHLSPKASQVDITLYPPELGSLRIQFQMEGDKMVARVHASEQAAANLLDKHLPELKAAMSQAGIEVQEFDISSGRDGGELLFDRPGQSSKKNSSALRKDDDSGNNEDSDQDSREPALAVSGDSGVDLFA